MTGQSWGGRMWQLMGARSPTYGITTNVGQCGG